MVKNEPWLRLDLIETTYDRIIQLFIQINKELKEDDRLFITIEETDLVLDKIKLETMRTRMLGWHSESETASEQMYNKPKDGTGYG